MKRTCVLTALAIAMTGCATSSKDIATSYVSPVQYQNYDCDQLGAEAHRLTGRLQQLGGRLDEAASNDKAITGVALLLFWPAAFALGGTKQQEAEYARLKGESEAIQQAAMARRCPTVLPTLTATATPAPTAAAAPAEKKVCVSKGRSTGARFTIPGEGEHVVKQILPHGGNCLSSVADWAVVVPVEESEAPPARLVPVVAPVPAKAPPAPSRSVSERLRDLKKLREENLITQEVYDAKQRDILSGH